LDKTLRGLENDKVIRVRRNPAGKIDQVELSDAERQCGRENFDFYCFLIWPFIEASWLGAVSLMGLTPPLGQEQDMWCEMKQTQDKAQLVRYRGNALLLSRDQSINYILAGQNPLSPRRSLLLRGRQQRDIEERLPAIRGRGNHNRFEE